jgi:hypothetical protein
VAFNPQFPDGYLPQFPEDGDEELELETDRDQALLIPGVGIVVVATRLLLPGGATVSVTPAYSAGTSGRVKKLLVFGMLGVR